MNGYPFNGGEKIIKRKTRDFGAGNCRSTRLAYKYHVEITGYLTIFFEPIIIIFSISLSPPRCHPFERSLQALYRVEQLIHS